MKFRLYNYIAKALDQGRTVEITKADDYGFHIEIDGVPLTRRDEMIERGREDHGLPHETFEIGVPDTVSEAAESKMKEIEQEYAESKVIEDGEVPRLKESGIPTRMLKVMYDNGMSPWQIQKWMPESVYSMDVKAGILYQCRREKEQAEKKIETTSVNSNKPSEGDSSV